MQRYGFRLGAARFVAGESLDAAVPVLRGLNDKGLLTNTTLLGEGVTTEAETAAVVAAYRELLDRIAAEGLRTNVALKLTHLGLAFDEELAYRNVAELVGHAARHGNFVRIDMEESARVDPTLRIYRRLREAGHDNVGAVLQSYLYRSEADLAALAPLAPNLRLVKGAYLEPAEVAYPEKSDVDAAYVRLLETRAHGRRLHGDRDARRDAHRARDRVRDGARRSPRERFQFQMLYGVRPHAAARPRPPRLRRARRGAVRPRLVPLPHAEARRTARERALPPAQSRSAAEARERRGERDEGEVAREEVPDPRATRGRSRVASSSTGTTSASGRARAGGSRGRDAGAAARERDERNEPDEVLRREHLVERDERSDRRRSRHQERVRRRRSPARVHDAGSR